MLLSMLARLTHHLGLIHCQRPICCPWRARRRPSEISAPTPATARSTPPRPICSPTYTIRVIHGQQTVPAPSRSASPTQSTHLCAPSGSASVEMVDDDGGSRLVRIVVASQVNLTDSSPYLLLPVWISALDEFQGSVAAAAAMDKSPGAASHLRPSSLVNRGMC